MAYTKENNQIIPNFPGMHIAFNLWTPIRHFPSSGLITMLVRLDSVHFSLQSDHINLSYQGGCQSKDNNQ